MEAKDTGAPADAGEAAQDDHSVMASSLAVDGDMAIELSKLLESFGTPPPVRVRFIDDPYSSTVMFQTTSSDYVTINGNEETCGSSFSDSDSSVMASIDVGGEWGLKLAVAREWWLGVSGLLVDGCDYGDEDREREVCINGGWK